MKCLFCGKGIGPIRQLRDLEFCTESHRTQFKERYRQHVYEALAPEPGPSRLADFMERPAESGGPALHAVLRVLPKPLPQDTAHRRCSIAPALHHLCGAPGMGSRPESGFHACAAGVSGIGRLLSYCPTGTAARRSGPRHSACMISPQRRRQCRSRFEPKRHLRPPARWQWRHPFPHPSGRYWDQGYLTGSRARSRAAARRIFAVSSVTGGYFQHPPNPRLSAPCRRPFAPRRRWRAAASSRRPPRLLRHARSSARRLLLVGATCCRNLLPSSRSRLPLAIHRELQTAVDRGLPVAFEAQGTRNTTIFLPKPLVAAAPSSRMSALAAARLPAPAEARHSGHTGHPGRTFHWQTRDSAAAIFLPGPLLAAAPSSRTSSPRGGSSHIGGEVHESRAMPGIQAGSAVSEPIESDVQSVELWADAHDRNRGSVAGLRAVSLAIVVRRSHRFRQQATRSPGRSCFAAGRVSRGLPSAYWPDSCSPALAHPRKPLAIAIHGLLQEAAPARIRTASLQLRELSAAGAPRGVRHPLRACRASLRPADPVPAAPPAAALSWGASLAMAPELDRHTLVPLSEYRPAADPIVCPRPPERSHRTGRTHLAPRRGPRSRTDLAPCFGPCAWPMCSSRTSNWIRSG